jgi:hypothetical protein
MTKFENVEVFIWEKLCSKIVIFEPKRFPYKYSNIFKPIILFTYPPMKMEQTECSETSAYIIQTPGYYPEAYNIVLQYPVLNSIYPEKQYDYLVLQCKPTICTPFKLINKLNAAISQVYCLSFKYSSTCFGHPHVHHQEVNNCSSSLWFCRWSVVVEVVLVVVGQAGRPDHDQQHCYHHAPTVKP